MNAKYLFFFLLFAIFLSSCKKKSVTPVSAPSDQITVSTFAGSGQGVSVDATGLQASFSRPRNIAIDASGNLYVTEGLSIRKVTVNAVASTLKINNQDDLYQYVNSFGIAVDNSNNIFLSNSSYGAIRKITNGDIKTIFSSVNSSLSYGLQQAGGLAVDRVGNLYVAGFNSNGIIEISPNELITAFAGDFTSDGRKFPSVYGTYGTRGNSNGPVSAATFNSPSGVAVDNSGNVYVADSGNNLIRKISNGVVTTLAGSGNASFADGKGNAASFYNPTGITADSYGNIYVADSGNNRIRKITSDGTVSTLAGDGSIGAVNGLGMMASFNNPTSLVVDKSGIIYVTDNGNNLIRKITFQ